MSLTKVSYSMVQGAPINVLDYGADSTGVTDSTASIQAAIAYAMAGGHKMVYFPQGTYSVSTILISNPAYTLTLFSAGAEFSGNATTSAKGIFDLVNCYDLNMLGAYKLNVGGNANYAAGLSIRSAAGGNGGTTRNSFYNITVRQAKIGISVGEYNNDLACSELDFFGCKFFQCPVAIYNAGSQTLSQWQGCEIISEPFAGYSGSPERAIWIEGGVVSVTGGSIVKGNTATPQTILFNPASSATFGNPYGGLRIAGVHIESNCQLLTIANSRALATPGSNTSNVTIVASGGYAGLSAAEDFITVSDSTYAGTVEVTSCNFYAPSARSAFSISCVNTNPVLVTDYRSFGNNFRPWYDGGFSFGTDASIFPYNGSYTATATGMTTSPTGTIIYSRVGKSVTMSIPNIFGTSNSAQFTLTGGDAAMKPTSNRVAQVVVGDNGGAAVMAIAIIGTNGIIQLFANLSGTGFTASGTKSVGECTLSYVI